MVLYISLCLLVLHVSNNLLQISKYYGDLAVVFSAMLSSCILSGVEINRYLGALLIARGGSLFLHASL